MSRFWITTAIVLAGASCSAEEKCDLALQLSFDVSVSMNESEFRWMRKGTASALLDDDVSVSFDEGVVWLQIVEWADRQALVLDWTRVRRSDLEKVAGLLNEAPRSVVGSSTGLGNAMLFAAGQFATGPQCDRRVLDIAGDGESNTGPHPQSVVMPDQSIQINTLATTKEAANFYQTFVARGPGAFVEIVDGYKKFHEAMRDKMTRELKMM